GFSQALSPDGKTLTISQIKNGSAVAVLKIEITDAATGAYKVTQLAAIDHPSGSAENNVAFTANYIVTDHDGDTATGTLAINVDDDTPTGGVSTAIQLDDDVLTGGIANGTGDDVETAGAPIVSGTLTKNFGADGAGSVLLTNATLPATGGFSQALSPD